MKVKVILIVITLLVAFTGVATSNDDYSPIPGRPEVHYETLYRDSFGSESPPFHDRFG